MASGYHPGQCSSVEYVVSQPYFNSFTFLVPVILINPLAIGVVKSSSLLNFSTEKWMFYKANDPKMYVYQTLQLFYLHDSPVLESWASNMCVYSSLILNVNLGSFPFNSSILGLRNQICVGLFLTFKNISSHGTPVHSLYISFSFLNFFHLQISSWNLAFGTAQSFPGASSSGSRT